MSFPVNANTLVIDKLVEAYNSGNARAFADLFAPDALSCVHPGTITERSREEVYRLYRERFAQFPQNRTEVLHRIVIGDYVMDHERVRRSPEAEPFEVLAIYLVQDSLIQRFDMVRKT